MRPLKAPKERYEGAQHSAGPPSSFATSCQRGAGVEGISPGKRLRMVAPETVTAYDLGWRKAAGFGHLPGQWIHAKSDAASPGGVARRTVRPHRVIQARPAGAGASPLLVGCT